LILASASPQRRAILEQAGIAFEVRPAGVEELDAGDPRHVAEENARRKALAVPGELVLGADTDVALDGEIAETAVVVTRVTFRAAGPELVDWYIARGEWRGRAGGYAIQGAGAVLVDSIEGDYLNVVGLPLAKLLDLRPQLLPAA
jgi:septum formation protein